MAMLRWLMMRLGCKEWLDGTLSSDDDARQRSPNLQQLLQECDVSIDQMLFDAVSTAEYGLLPEEKYHGVCLIDIGASTTFSICVYREDKLIYTPIVLPKATSRNTDISMPLDVTIGWSRIWKKILPMLIVMDWLKPIFTIKRSQHDDEKPLICLSSFEVTEACHISIFRSY